MGFLAQATRGIYLVYGFRGVVLPACVEPFFFFLLLLVNEAY